MSFISTEFLVFFPIVLLLYFGLPFRFRWILLLTASYIFYAYWNTSYIFLIVFTTLVDYLAARLLGRTDSSLARRRKLLLAASLTVNLGTLFIFKYFNFFNESLASLIPSYTAVPLNVLLPVGVSFYTFQSMAYTIDVYRGTIQPEKHLGIFATYVAFFPQLVAGPIERAGNLLPQFRLRFEPDYHRMVEGLRLILWGAFKKVVIADRVAVYVNAVYNNASDYAGAPLIAATVFFAFQIYCDFSGYSDIAIGVAKVMGFSLMTNFRQPYLATSVREFWRRWHISLSTWFRDYLYFPLGGSRVTLARNLLNLMVVFVVSGLWHGANWTFFIWGALHGGFIVIETWLAKRGGTLKSHSPWLSMSRLLVTFTLVCIAWIFFRANTLEDSIYICSHLLDFSSGMHNLIDPLVVAGLRYPVNELIYYGVLIFGLSMVDWADSRSSLLQIISRFQLPVRWAIYYSLLGAIAYSLMSYNGAGPTFIYFQF